MITRVVSKARALEAEARSILATVESAKQRRFTLDASYKALGQLSIKQDNLFKQALRCVEHELYRAAHVMAWAACVDFLHEKLGEDNLAAVNSKRPSWNVNAVEDLRSWADHQIIEVARDCNLLTKTSMKAFHGLLNKRNECAHPEDYFPALNDTLGYMDELFKRISALQARAVHP